MILIKSGLHWGTALIFNFLSSLTAIIGFFIGVAISSNSSQANGWILSLAAGLFLYIALTDLVSEMIQKIQTHKCTYLFFFLQLPELIHGGDYVKLTKTGWRWSLRFFLTNLGFFIAFVVLLVLALYEEELNELIG